MFIDGLRGLALLMVLTYHAWLHSVGDAIHTSLAGFRLDPTAAFQFGYLGVHLFLVLSGFCLTYPLAKGDMRVDLDRFFRRRAWRILPPYYVALIGFILVRLWLQRPTEWGDVVTHLLLIHNLWPQWMGSINGTLRSLAQEVQLYMLFPVLVIGMRRWGALRTLAAALVITQTYRTFVWFTQDLGFYWCYSLPGRFFEFVLGMGAAVALARRRSMLTPAWQARYRIGVFAFGLLGAVVAIYWSPFSPVTDVIWGLAFFSLVMYAGARHAARSPILTWRPLVALGTISYSIYLLHAPLLRRTAMLLRPYEFPPALLWAGFELVLVPLAIGIGWLFYQIVESRFIGTCPDLRWPVRLGGRPARRVLSRSSGIGA